MSKNNKLDHAPGSATSINDNDLDQMERPDDHDLENPMILQTNESVGEYSFIDDRQKYNKLAPPPKYMTADYLRQNMELSLPPEP